MERAELPTVRGRCPVWCAPPRKRLRKFLCGKEFVETLVAASSSISAVPVTEAKSTAATPANSSVVASSVERRIDFTSSPRRGVSITGTGSESTDRVGDKA